MRARHALDGDARFAFPDDGRWALTWEDLLTFRHRGGLPGHAEMAGKTLLFKANTGPSGHGMPVAAGEALALKMAGCGEVKVFVVEGEGGLTPGVTHETLNSAWGLGLGNLVFLVDWNDFGIDPRAASSVIYGTPEDWFGSHGWRALGTPDGMAWEPVLRTALEAARGDNPAGLPTMAWFRTHKGRGYGKHDAASHGIPHALNSPAFWAGRKDFCERHGIAYEGVDEPAPDDRGGAPGAGRGQPAAGAVGADPGRGHRALAVRPPRGPGGLGAGRHRGLHARRRHGRHLQRPGHHRLPLLPRRSSTRRRARSSPTGPRWAPGAPGSTPIAKQHYGRPLIVACSADLAESTNIAGFAKDFGDLPGWGWYERDANPRGTRPAPGDHRVRQRRHPGRHGVGQPRAGRRARPSTASGAPARRTRSFSYLKYGPLRLFSQMAQDSELKLGKVIWIAGHSGPETAEDSRTHFGIFETGVTQLFPEGAVIDLHPWEYNEVPVVLGAALATDVPIVALHLTRPPVAIPDREALGMPSHFEAARGAYVMRPFRDGQPTMGTVFVRGTVPTANLVKILPELDRRGPQRQDRGRHQPAALPAARTRPTARPPCRSPTAGTPWPSRTAPDASWPTG